MSRNYYYLVAALPELQLDKSNIPVSSLEFVDVAKEELHPADFALLNNFRFPFDNLNLLAMVNKKKRPFDGRAVFGEAVLAEWIARGGATEPYIERFLDEYHAAPGDRTPAEMLARSFSEAMVGSEHQFTAEWYRFEQHLKNCCTALTLRQFADGEGAKRRTGIIGRDDVAEAFATSNAADFGLSREFFWMGTIVEASRGTMVSFEKTIDTVRWEMADTLTMLEDFGINRILAWFVKLVIAERWALLDAETGRRSFDALCRELIDASTGYKAGAAV